MPAGEARIVLQPDRLRLAKTMINCLRIAAASDQKKYASGKTFLPIFPTNNTALQAALTVVMNQLETVVDA